MVPQQTAQAAFVYANGRPYTEKPSSTEPRLCPDGSTSPNIIEWLDRLDDPVTESLPTTTPPPSPPPSLAAAVAALKLPNPHRNRKGLSLNTNSVSPPAIPPKSPLRALQKGMNALNLTDVSKPGGNLGKVSSLPRSKYFAARKAAAEGRGATMAWGGRPEHLK
ncbi:Uu.00g125740.m01.CDS01 [Anthostomella pinea]|uniref:Uu.00g125740.m01.CDS01 n=1 Tax=Anthostomella pinea TaxID=933095 RepID=A0AAI8VHU5_9PEZI|nr:Uu.00g125740.m01.CDS01 [Anthostomella pinea]